MIWPDRFAACRIWPWNRLYELKNLSPYQREAVWGECARASGGGLRSLGRGFVGLIAASAISILVEQFHLDRGRNVPEYLQTATQLLFVVLPVAGIVSGWGLTRRAVRARIVEQYRGSRFPYCLWCGYELRGLTDEQTDCPECGKPCRGDAAIPKD